MNTEKVKNILIFVLIITILTLGSLALAEENHYRLTQNQEDAIISILNRNGIAVYADIIRDFSPLPQLSLEMTSPDLDDIAGRFFQDETYYITEDVHHFIFEAQSRRMTFFRFDNKLRFEIHDGFNNSDFIERGATASSSQILAESYVRNLVGIPNSMEFSSISLNFMGDYVITYFGNYRNFVIYNNQIRVRVTEAGVTRIYYSYSPIQGVLDNDVFIVSADEALLSLINHLRTSGVLDGDDIILTNIQLMHFITESGIASPAYVFSLFIDRIQFNFIFDAQTNGFLYYESIW